MAEQYFMGLDGFIWFVGVVENRNDPAELGRVQVRCLGYHTEDLTLIPTADLPWAHVMHPVTDPSMQGLGNTPSFLVEGSWVVGFFRDARDKQQPIIMGTLPGYPEELPDTKLGFNDPNKLYFAWVDVGHRDGGQGAVHHGYIFLKSKYISGKSKYIKAWTYVQDIIFKPL